MQPIDEDSIKRITNGDLIVRGYPDEILKSDYQDGWCVVNNLRETEELEVERSGMLVDFPVFVNPRQKINYNEFTNNHWYILDAELR
jgi:hypothetical protein